MKVYHERKSSATKTDEPPEKQAPGMGNGKWGMGQPEGASAGRERGKPIIPIAPPEPL